MTGKKKKKGTIDKGWLCRQGGGGGLLWFGCQLTVGWRPPWEGGGAGSGGSVGGGGSRWGEFWGGGEHMPPRRALVNHRLPLPPGAVTLTVPSS